MAASSFPSVSAPATQERLGLIPVLPKSAFPSTTKFFFIKPSFSSSNYSYSHSVSRNSGVQRRYNPPSATSFCRIPKQFREENLKDGVMDNYKNVPQNLYGLTSSQLGMFTTEDNPFRRLSASVTEESISSANSYMAHLGLNLSAMSDISQTKYNSSLNLFSGGKKRPRMAPPDLPTLLLEGRILYLCAPILPPVVELVIAQLMWLDFDNSSKPIYLYINSTGTQDEDGEIVGYETDAFAIADAMAAVKSDVYTINVSMASGQAALLLSLGKKGHRGLLRNAYTQLYLPKAIPSFGRPAFMWFEFEELDRNIQTYVKLLAKATGKSKEQITEDIQRGKPFTAKEAIEYGLADKIILTLDSCCAPQEYRKMISQAKAMRALRGSARPRASPVMVR